MRFQRTTLARHPSHVNRFLLSETCRLSTVRREITKPCREADELVGLVISSMTWLVAAADLRLQQNRYALWKRVSLANRIAETGRATLITSCVISSMPRSL